QGLLVFNPPFKLQPATTQYLIKFLAEKRKHLTASTGNATVPANLSGTQNQKIERPRTYFSLHTN
ncbi:MAG: hypothetical protein ACPLKZ_06915, partial [Candidatus Bathyarchaeales archaeon]